MGSGSVRPNNAEEKMIASIERGDQSEFKDRKPPKNWDKKAVKARKAAAEKARKKTEALKALRLAAEEEHKAQK